MPREENCYDKKKSRVRRETAKEPDRIFSHSVVRKGPSEAKFGNLVRNLTELREERFSLKEEQVLRP